MNSHNVSLGSPQLHSLLWHMLDSPRQCGCNACTALADFAMAYKVAQELTK